MWRENRELVKDRWMDKRNFEESVGKTEREKKTRREEDFKELLSLLNTTQICAHIHELLLNIYVPEVVAMRDLNECT